jgi:carbamoyl-phosphate synthase large subunit
MKSVGEVMGIGRNFQEALQKACQSLEIRRNGLGADGKELTDQEDLLYSLRRILAGIGSFIFTMP